MSRIFVDAGPFQALNNEDDQYFTQAGEMMRSIKGKGMVLVTTDYVIDEVYTALLIRAGYQNAMHFDQYLRLGGWEIIFVSQNYFSMAQQIFRRYNKDKRWSFTDCTSYVVMKELKIKTVFTFDEHFKEMGFRLLSSSNNVHPGGGIA